MVAMSLQRLINETTLLDFSFIFIGQRVLEGTVGEKSSVFTLMH